VKVEQRREVGAQAAGARELTAGREDAGGQERRCPRPHAEQLPGVERVAADDGQRGTVGEHGPRHATRPDARRDPVRRVTDREPRERAAEHRAAAGQQEREPVAAQRERHSGQPEGHREAERMAADEESHRPPAPGRGDVLGDEQDAGRVGAAQDEAQQRVEDEAGRVVVDEGREADGPGRGRHRAGPEHAPGAEAIGQLRASHERERVRDLERRRDRAGGGAGHLPRAAGPAAPPHRRCRPCTRRPARRRGSGATPRPRA
jgi:hypothetical protein